MTTLSNTRWLASAANFCLGLSVTALIMAEYGISSLLGDWQPTHGTAITLAVLSVAFSSLGHYYGKPIQTGSEAK